MIWQVRWPSEGVADYDPELGDVDIYNEDGTPAR